MTKDEKFPLWPEFLKSLPPIDRALCERRYVSHQVYGAFRKKSARILTMWEYRMYEQRQSELK